MNLRRVVLCDSDNDRAEDLRQALHTVVPRLFKKPGVVCIVDEWESENEIIGMDEVIKLASSTRRYVQVKLCEWIKNSVFENVVLEKEYVH